VSHNPSDARAGFGCLTCLERLLTTPLLTLPRCTYVRWSVPDWHHFVGQSLLSTRKSLHQVAATAPSLHSDHSCFTIRATIAVSHAHPLPRPLGHAATGDRWELGQAEPTIIRVRALTKQFYRRDDEVDLESRRALSVAERFADVF
jgi:hypothetical protein